MLMEDWLNLLLSGYLEYSCSTSIYNVPEHMLAFLKWYSPLQSYAIIT